MTVPRLYDSAWTDGSGIGQSGVLNLRASTLKEAVVVGCPLLTSCQVVRSPHYRSTGGLRHIVTGALLYPPAGSKPGLE